VGVVSWIPDPNYLLITAELGAEINQTAQDLVNNLMPDQITAWALNPAGTQMQAPELKPSSRILPGSLTYRELEISRLITQGLSNRQIAGHLYISYRTVDAHVRHILEKLDLNTRAQISAWYTEHCVNSLR
jgi:DNA-binding CsgD family transcriptional regulator